MTFAYGLLTVGRAVWATGRLLGVPPGTRGVVVLIVPLGHCKGNVIVEWPDKRTISIPPDCFESLTTIDPARDAFVGPVAPDSLVGTARKAAGLDREPVLTTEAYSNRELATVLAALR